MDITRESHTSPSKKRKDKERGMNGKRKRVRDNWKVERTHPKLVKFSKIK
jgi:hypothetical protein